MPSRLALAAAIILACIAACIPDWDPPGGMICEDGCSTSSSAGVDPTSTGDHTPTTSTQDTGVDSTGVDSSDTGSEPGSSTTAAEQEEPPSIVDFDVEPDLLEDNGLIHVDVLTLHADGVRMQLETGDVVELTPGQADSRPSAVVAAWRFMPKAERVIGGGADGESGAGRGPASESCTQAASAGSRSRSSSAARTTSWTCASTVVMRSGVGGGAGKKRSSPPPCSSYAREPGAGRRTHITARRARSRVGSSEPVRCARAVDSNATIPPLGGPPQDERTSTRLVEWQAMSLLHRLHAPEVGRGGRPATRAGIDRRGPAPDGGRAREHCAKSLGSGGSGIDLLAEAIYGGD
jgi:hypothetical protein